MSLVYTTQEGDMLDDIAFKTYQDERMVVEILNANPTLANQPVVLPAGITLKLPSKPTPTTKNTLKSIWG